MRALPWRVRRDVSYIKTKRRGVGVGEKTATPVVLGQQRGLWPPRMGESGRASFFGGGDRALDTSPCGGRLQVDRSPEGLLDERDDGQGASTEDKRKLERYVA